MPRIFISYRRADTGDLCDRLATRLRWAFGEDAVFRDVNTILAGSTFSDALREGVEACPVMLALIGPRWLTPVGAPPRRRIDDADDWVRAEIASALRLGHLVIPVLAPGAPTLAGANLPPDLEPLTRFTPMALRPDPVFDADVQALTQAIKPHVRQGPASWLLLLGGVFLALAYLNAVVFHANLTPGYGIVEEASWVAGVALGTLLSWRAAERREWGWLAAGALTALCGLTQFAGQAAPDGVAIRLYTVINLGASPLAAGLCVLAGLFGPRVARAPDTLRQRWSGWHIALATLLGVTTALLALNWLLLAIAFSAGGLVDLLYLGGIFVTALMTFATGILASVRAFTYRRVWWGAGAVALTVTATLAEGVWIFVSSTSGLVASILLPAVFLVFNFLWLRSYASRSPAPVRRAAPQMERA